MLRALHALHALLSAATTSSTAIAAPIAAQITDTVKHTQASIREHEAAGTQESDKHICDAQPGTA